MNNYWFITQGKDLQKSTTINRLIAFCEDYNINVKKFDDEGYYFLRNISCRYRIIAIKWTC